MPTITAAPRPENHSNGLAICRDVKEAIKATKDIPAWTWVPGSGWTATFSLAWKESAEAVMTKHGIDAPSFLAFCRYVRSTL